MEKSGLFPNLRFADVHSDKDKDSKCKLSPDIVVYRSGETYTTRLSWGDIEIIIEFKVDPGTDGYRKTRRAGEALEEDTEKAQEFRGQMYSYAGQLLHTQNRLFVFGLSFHADFARVYRFDPSCVVVSEPIYYQKNPAQLLEIFWRFSAMSPAQRGHDPTVAPASSEEKKLFKARVNDYLERVEKDNLRLHPDIKRLDNNIVKIQVNDETDGTIHSYLACKPLPDKDYVCTGFSPCGQIPRGFFATPYTSTTVKVREGLRSTTTHTTTRSTPPKGVLFWLRDSWRSSLAESETTILNDLKTNNVPNIPEIRHGGDVQVGTTTQETLNDTLRFESSAQSWIRPTLIIHHMVHCRIVHRLLIPLGEVKNARELVLVGRDILIGQYALVVAENL